MRPKTDLIIGCVIIVAVFAVTWAAVGFFLACFIWLFTAASFALLHFLLYRNSRLAAAGFAAFQWNTLLLLFLPKRNREQLRELREKEANRSVDTAARTGKSPDCGGDLNDG